MKRKLLILASTFFLAGCGGSGVGLKEGQVYTFGNNVTISASEDDQTKFFSMIQEMKGYARLDSDNKFYNVTSAETLGNYFVDAYKSLKITFHFNEPKDFFAFTWGTSTYDILGGLKADGSFCDNNGDGTFYEARAVGNSTEVVSCNVINRFKKLNANDVSVEITASISDFNISDSSYTERSKVVINAAVSVTK